MNLKLNINRNFFTECCYFCICWIWTCDTSSRGWTLTSHNDQSSGNCLRLSVVVCSTRYYPNRQMLFRYPFASSWCSSLWPQYIVKGVIIFTKYFYDFTTFKARARGHPDSFFLVLRIFSSTKKKNSNEYSNFLFVSYMSTKKVYLWYLSWISIQRMPVKCFLSWSP